MKGKKVLGIFVLGIVLLSVYYVSAQYYSGFSGGADGASYWMENNVGPVFGVFLGGVGDLLFERVLMFFILVAFIFVILKRMKIFKDNIAVIWIVTLAVSLLATRYMSDLSMVKNVLLPYTVLGVALTAALPFIIYFFFVQSFDESSTLRKILWIFFIVVFLGIWADRQAELGELSYIYVLTGLVALICLLFDGTIRRALQRDKAKQQDYKQKQEMERHIRNKLYDLEKDYNEKKSISPDTYYKSKRDLEKQLRTIYRN